MGIQKHVQVATLQYPKYYSRSMRKRKEVLVACEKDFTTGEQRMAPLSDGHHKTRVFIRE